MNVVDVDGFFQNHTLNTCLIWYWFNERDGLERSKFENNRNGIEINQLNEWMYMI